MIDENKIAQLYEESLKQFDELLNESNFLVSNYRKIFDEKLQADGKIVGLLNAHYEGYLLAMEGKVKATDGKLKVAGALEKIRQYNINLELKKKSVEKSGGDVDNFSNDFVRDLANKMELYNAEKKKK